MTEPRHDHDAFSTGDHAAPDPFGCALCYGEDAGAAFARPITTVRCLRDNFQVVVSLMRCKNCGQAFLQVASHRFGTGPTSDRQTADRIPVSEREAREVAAIGASVDLGYLRAVASNRRKLRAEKPVGGTLTCRWEFGPVLPWC